MSENMVKQKEIQAHRDLLEKVAAKTADYGESKSRILKKYGSRDAIYNKCMTHLDDFANIFNRNYYEAFAAQCREQLFPYLFNLVNTVEEKPGIIESIRENMNIFPHVFLPNHDSNLDALVHGIFFYQNRLGPPKTTAGSNLCKDTKGTFIPQVIQQLKALNALIVNRQLLTKDILYLQLFRGYLLETLKNNLHHCFYIESGRSYEGRLKKEMISGMLSWSLETPVKKLAMVPLSISYSKCFDASDLYKCFINEEKMPSTNLLDEFKKGAKSLGADFPIIVRVGEPITLEAHKFKDKPHFLMPNNNVMKTCEEAISLKSVSKTIHKTVFNRIEAMRPIFIHYLLCSTIKNFMAKKASLADPQACVDLNIDQIDLKSAFNSLIESTENKLDFFSITSPKSPLTVEDNTLFEQGLDDLLKIGIIETAEENVVVKDPWAILFYSNKTSFLYEK